jgi:hypothetical protein
MLLALQESQRLQPQGADSKAGIHRDNLMAIAINESNNSFKQKINIATMTQTAC